MTELTPSEGLYGHAPQGQPNAPAPGVLEQVVGVFTEPVALFKRLAAAPAWKGALGTTMAFSVVTTIVWGLKVDVDAMIRPILEANPSLSADQVDKAIEMQSKFIVPGGVVGVLLGLPLFLLLASLIYWLIGKATAEGEKPSFPHALSATAVSGLFMLPHALLVILMCLVKPINGLTPEKITPTSLGYFVAVEGVKLHAFLYRMDLFTLGSLVLLFLAARHTMRLKVEGALACAGVSAMLAIVLPSLFAR
jgi:hypothetical protein